MPTYDQAMEALRAADAAGNTEDARRLAGIAKSLKGGSAPASGGNARDKSGDIVRATTKEAAGIGDLLFNVIPGFPAMMAESGGKLLEMAKEGFSPASKAEGARKGKAASAAVMNTFGSPLHRMLSFAGMGDSGPGVVDRAMEKVGGWLGKGGEWVEKNTGGVVSKDDVEFVANSAMELGGAKGMTAGLRKLVKPGMAKEAERFSKENLEKAQTQVRQQADPDVAAADVAKQTEQQVTLEQLESEAFPPLGKTGAKPKLKYSDVFGKVDEQGKPLAVPLGQRGAIDTKLFDKTFKDEKELSNGVKLVIEGGHPGPKVSALNKNGLLIGDVLFEPGTHPRELANAMADGVWVEDKWQRKGIATEMYRFAAEHGADIVPSAEGQTKMGSAMWRGFEKSGLAVNRKISAVPKSQSGAVDPKLLARLSAIGLGAWAGMYYGNDHDVTDAILGGAVGFGASKLDIAWSMAKNLKSPYTGIDINALGDAHDSTVRGAAIDVMKKQRQTEDLTPTGKDASVVAAAESGNHAGLSMNEAKAAQIMQQQFHSLGRVAKVAGVEASANRSYAAKLWDWSANARNPFKNDPNILTLAQGRARGLQPISENPAYLMGAYTASVAKALADKNYIRGLRSQATPTGVPLAGPDGTVPTWYVPINHPSFTGLKVHPDIAGNVKMLFDTSDPGAATKVLQGINDTSKRMAVSFSLFHAKALTDAMIAGTKNPLKSLKELPAFAMGTSQYLKELEKGTGSNLVRRALKGGLVFSLEKAGAAVEDAGVGFYPTMKALQGFLDNNFVQGAGKPIEGFMALNHKMDTFMWARLHAGMKLMTFQEKFTDLMTNSAKKGMPLTETQAAKLASSYTNDLFGGLNWRMIADEAKTKFGRDFGHAVLNPAGRRVLQLAMFAPDWTISTTRAMVQAFGKPDFIHPTTLAGLHQQYLLRSALYYLVVGDSINYAMSGHHLWQNKDWTFIDMDPNGYHRMQWSKHTMEPVHWMMKPAQQAANKLGFIPREGINQITGREFISTSGKSPPMDTSAVGRARHAIKSFEPIAVQQGTEGGAASAVSGFAGVPIYGKTPEEKKIEKEKRKRKKEKQP